MRKTFIIGHFNIKSIILLFFILIYYQNVQASNLAVGFLGQLALTGANTNSSKIFPSKFEDFDGGFIASLGYKKYITSSISSSILIDLGYYRDIHNFNYCIGDKKFIEKYNFNNFLIGGHLRVGFDFFSIGAGAGIKIPITATFKVNDSSYDFKFKDLNDMFEVPIIPYVKISFDFLILKSMLIGLYASYNFPYKFKQNVCYTKYYVNKKQISSVDIGIQFGFVDF